MFDEDDDDVEELYVVDDAETDEDFFGERTETESKEIVPRALTKEEACTYLSLLGKPAKALGIELAYLKIKINNAKLTDISVIPSFRHVMFVDVSYNFLDDEALTALGTMEFLLKFQADGNRITKCTLLTSPNLQVLTFNKNNIDSMEGITHPSLSCLEMNYNKITELTNLDSDILKNVKILELRRNLLRTTAGINCPNVERLYLAENGIEVLEDLELLDKLRILHLRDNTLKELNGFSKMMSSLTYLNLRDCQIKKIKEFRKLAVLPMLDTLIILGNPIVETLGEEYRIQTLSYLPTLKRLDKFPVQQDEIDEAEEMKKEREAAEGEEAEGEGEIEEEEVEEEEEEDDD